MQSSARARIEHEARGRPSGPRLPRNLRDAVVDLKRLRIGELELPAPKEQILGVAPEQLRRLEDREMREPVTERERRGSLGRHAPFAIRRSPPRQETAASPIDVLRLDGAASGRS